MQAILLQRVVVDSSLTGVVLERHLSVRAAAEAYGYNQQYLRRLLRAGRLQGPKIGQVWLIKLASLETYLRNGLMGHDRRFGPQGNVCRTDWLIENPLAAIESSNSGT
jgi:excisionase family DNA binding protein